MIAADSPMVAKNGDSAKPNAPAFTGIFATTSPSFFIVILRTLPSFINSFNFSNSFSPLFSTFLVNALIELLFSSK